MRPPKVLETPARRGWGLATLLATGAGIAGILLLCFWNASSTSPPVERDLENLLVVDAERDLANIAPLYGELPGEFELHDALVISWPINPVNEITPTTLLFVADLEQTILDVIAQVKSQIHVIVVVPTTTIREDVLEKMAKGKISLERVEVLLMELDTPWVRDFGPFTMRNPQTTWLACQFSHVPGQRDADGRMAKNFTSHWDLKPVEVPFYLDGGNLISNGQGLLITTTHTLEINREMGGSKRGDLNAMFRQYFGAKQIVYLEPLAEELNQHVDMFLTMPTPDTVVIAEYTDEQDSDNRELLERNIERLGRVPRKADPLKIVRIPMPPHGVDTFGGTYTNVVYANGILLVPEYKDTDPEGHAKAVAIYRQLLPDWKIISLQADAWISFNGSLHCLTKNLYRLPPRVSNSPGA